MSKERSCTSLGLRSRNGTGLDQEEDGKGIVVNYCSEQIRSLDTQ